MSQYVHRRFADAGIPNVETQPVDVLLSNPVGSSLELIEVTGTSDELESGGGTRGRSSGTVVFTAALAEDVLELDVTSDTWYRNHTYNG